MPSPVNQTMPAEVDDGVRSRVSFWLRNDATRLLFPSRCLACDDRGGDGIDLCAACASRLPWNHDACLRCALPLPVDAGSPQVCGACLQLPRTLAGTLTRNARRPAPLSDVRAACRYAAPIDRLLLRFKFHHDLAAGGLLAQLMAQALAGAPRPEALLPVPLHRSRLRRRGYDQALELARPLAVALGLPILDHLLVRIRATAPQSRLDAAQRRRNLAAAFAVQPGAALPRHVVLVDDVMTTGATLRAAALSLRRAGVERVDAWVCARVV